ncbi:hypothetical protein [Allobaculum sp. Allo2]|uniref:hypothetical protein n=1 Tax=Allobaculum sp. Allo2 TaxID=2853432 RepID=UPI001F61D471|nr:hypothetical protein [Allobaculum sp. Allo2]UNT93159.1 hypothetical protein KWG61_14305 [Allobaculum sp. Allo2]
MIAQNSIVVGTLTLDNYSEYLSYDNEALINDINTRIRTPLLAWAKEMHILMRRTRSDRYLLVLDSEILTSMRKKNFPILQKIKDAANKSDLSMTISAAFVSDQPSFLEIDRLLNELTELVQSRGGDQIAIKRGKSGRIHRRQFRKIHPALQGARPHCRRQPAGCHSLFPEGVYSGSR